MSQVRKNRLQRGFAMLEVLLAIVIIAVVGLAVVELYGKASSSTSLDTQERIVNDVISSWQQYASTYYAQPTLADLTANNLLPAGIIGTDNTINTSWGQIIATGGSGSFQQVTLEVDGIPGGSAKQFCRDMYQSYDVDSSESSSFSDITGCDTLGVGAQVLYITAPKGTFAAAT